MTGVQTCALPICLLVHSGSVDVAKGSSTKSVYLVISATDSLDGFLSLHRGEEAIPYPGDGEVVLNRGLAESLGVAQGDTVLLRSDDLGELEATVSAVSDNYVFNYAYLSADTYHQQTWDWPDFNTQSPKLMFSQIFIELGSDWLDAIK